VGSSTMAQKRNPQVALNLAALAAMLRSRVPLTLEGMVRMNEGDSGASNISDALVPEAAVLGISVARSVAELLGGIAVDADAMRRNLDITRGLILSEAVMMELARHIGRHHAHELLYEAAMAAFETGASLADALGKQPGFAELKGKVDLGKLLDPALYVGEAGDCVDDEVRRQGASEIRPRKHAAE
jgi:3-carboxy-cis,cis-muconate cycloisomerase